MRPASASAEMTTPANAASWRVVGWARAAIAAMHATAFARNRRPIQRTPWTSDVYCWMWTAASPASAHAPSANAAAATTAATVLCHGRAEALVVISAARAARDLVTSRREHVPFGTERIQSLAGRVAGLLVAGVAVDRVAVVRDL